MAGELLVIFGPKVSLRHTRLPVAASIASKLPLNVVTNSSVLTPPEVGTWGSSTGELSTISGSVFCQSCVRLPTLLRVIIVSDVFTPLREPPPSNAGHVIGDEEGVAVGEGVCVGIKVGQGQTAVFVG